MRPFVLALLLALAPGSAFATCLAVPDDGSTHYIANEMAVTLCRQAEVSDTQRRQQQQLDLQAALQAQQLKFDFELRMQQLQSNTLDMSSVPSF